MSKHRDIEMIYSVDRAHWVGDGFKVRNYFPSGRNLLERFSPFILLDYGAPLELEPTLEKRGVGPHPHRGFETVTFAFEGAVEHHDNHGNHGIIYPGDVQWMTAGSGVLHQEYLEKEFLKKGGKLHMIQLWVNLPKKDKMTQPKYQALLKDQMGHYQAKGVEVAITAGRFKDIKGPASTFTPMNLYAVKLDANASLEFEEPSHHHVGFLVTQGKAKIQGQDVKAMDFVLLKDEAGSIEFSAEEDSHIFVLSGEPINEPIVAHGPFVMNTQEEIMQANKDFYAGKFGSFEF